LSPPKAKKPKCPILPDLGGEHYERILNAQFEACTTDLKGISPEILLLKRMEQDRLFEAGSKLKPVLHSIALKFKTLGQEMCEIENGESKIACNKLSPLQSSTLQMLIANLYYLRTDLHAYTKFEEFSAVYRNPIIEKYELDVETFSDVDKDKLISDANLKFLALLFVSHEQV
jgi:hypothetical protein